MMQVPHDVAELIVESELQSLNRWHLIDISEVCPAFARPCWKKLFRHLVIQCGLPSLLKNADPTTHVTLDELVEIHAAGQSNAKSWAVHVREITINEKLGFADVVRCLAIVAELFPAYDRLCIGNQDQNLGIAPTFPAWEEVLPKRLRFVKLFHLCLDPRGVAELVAYLTALRELELDHCWFFGGGPMLKPRRTPDQPRPGTRVTMRRPDVSVENLLYRWVLPCRADTGTFELEFDFLQDHSGMWNVIDAINALQPDCPPSFPPLQARINFNLLDPPPMSPFVFHQPLFLWDSRALEAGPNLMEFQIVFQAAPAQTHIVVETIAIIARSHGFDKARVIMSFEYCKADLDRAAANRSLLAHGTGVDVRNVSLRIDVPRCGLDGPGDHSRRVEDLWSTWSSLPLAKFDLRTRETSRRCCAKCVRDIADASRKHRRKAGP